MLITTQTTEITISDSEFELSYARSSGPGGQNVNKVNSKAILRWNLITSPSLSLDMREWLLSRLRPQLNTNGEILTTSDRFRDQIRNREDCFEKFRELMITALTRPKKRKKTKPSFSSQRKVKEAKTRNSQKKSSRRPPRISD